MTTFNITAKLTPAAGLQAQGQIALRIRAALSPMTSLGATAGQFQQAHAAGSYFAALGRYPVGLQPRIAAPPSNLAYATLTPTTTFSAIPRLQLAAQLPLALEVLVAAGATQIFGPRLTLAPEALLNANLFVQPGGTVQLTADVVLAANARLRLVFRPQQLIPEVVLADTMLQQIDKAFAALTVGALLNADLAVAGKIDLRIVLAAEALLNAEAVILGGIGAGVNPLAVPGMVAPPGRLMAPIAAGADGSGAGVNGANLGPDSSDAGMSQQVARLGDTSTHGGKIITAAKNTIAEGRPVARVGDILNCPIHGKNPIVTGSTQFLTEGAQTARIHSRTACNATILSDAQHTIAA